MIMKWYYSAERKCFPYDSPFQRIRRRWAVVFGVIAVPLLILGVAKAMTKLSNMQGRQEIKSNELTLKPSGQR